MKGGNLYQFKRLKKQLRKRLKKKIIIGRVTGTGRLSALKKLHRRETSSTMTDAERN